MLPDPVYILDELGTQKNSFVGPYRQDLNHLITNIYILHNCGTVQARHISFNYICIFVGPYRQDLNQLIINLYICIFVGPYRQDLSFDSHVLTSELIITQISFEFVIIRILMYAYGTVQYSCSYPWTLTRLHVRLMCFTAFRTDAS